MITNERQYRITKSELNKLQTGLAALDRNEEGDEFADLHKAALKSHIDEFSILVAEYEELAEKKSRIIEAESLSDLPRALIRARLARGLSQKELAERLDVKEQQVQRWEANYYDNASFANLKRVVEALEVRMREEIFVPTGPLLADKLVNRLKEYGIPTRLLTERLLPSGFSQADEMAEGAVFKVATRIGRIFDLSMKNLFGEEENALGMTAVHSGRFKAPANANTDTLNVYALYAHYLAALTAQVTTHLPTGQLPTDWSTARSAILKKYPKIDFRAVLNYAWDSGVPVLPLDDPGAFHGAIWRFSGRNVIVLKQRKQYSAYWLHDLLHELRHAAEEQDNSTFALVEQSPIAEERRQSPSEEAANDFAEDVVFGNRSDEIEDACFKEASDAVPRLKTAIPRISERYNVDQGYLANYIAHVLQEFKGINFWGAAINLQENDYNAFEFARQVFFERVSLGRLNAIDREILMDGLKGGVETNAEK